MKGFTDLPERDQREPGAIYIASWGGEWFIMQVTGASDRSVTPIAGPYKSRPEIALSVRAEDPHAPSPL